MEVLAMTGWLAGQGNDFMVGGAGDDEMDGGLGDDWVFGDATNEPVDLQREPVRYAIEYASLNRGRDSNSR